MDIIDMINITNVIQIVNSIHSTNDVLNLISNHADPRTTNWFMMNSPVPTIALVGFYIFLSIYLGPNYMRKKHPMQNQAYLKCYNAFRFFLSSYLFYKGSKNGFLRNYLEICDPSQRGSIENVELSWMYFMSTFLDLIDTMFLISKKKRVSLWLVMHHALLPLLGWLEVKLSPANYFTLSRFMNSFVDIFVYVYFLLPVPNTVYRKILRIIKSLEYYFILIHAIQGIMDQYCVLPHDFGLTTIVQIILLMNYFFDYYTEWRKRTSIFPNDPEWYRKFFEMCIPDQHLLFDHDEKTQ